MGVMRASEQISKRLWTFERRTIPCMLRIERRTFHFRSELEFVSVYRGYGTNRAIDPHLTSDMLLVHVDRGVLLGATVH